MGFFFDDKPRVTEAAQPTAPRGRRGPKQEPISMHNHPRGCDACPLQETWPRISTPHMPMSGQRDGDILVIGEGPGEQEDLDGVIFVGKTGKFLRKQFPIKDMERIAFTNAVRCRPPGNRTPTGLEMHCCSTYLEDDIAKGNFKYLLLVGQSALSRFIQGVPITHIHGMWFPVEVAGKSLWAMAIMHPSFVERTGGERSSYYPCFRADINRFFKEGPKRRKPVVEHPKPENVVCIYNEADARHAIKQMRGVRGIDIETSKLKPYERDAKIITGAISDGDITIAFPVEHPEDTNDWGVRLLLEVAQKYEWIAHQAAFEYAWFIHYADRLKIPFRSNKLQDSMGIGRLYHGRAQLLGLDIMSNVLLGINIKSLTNVNPRRIMEFPLEEVLPYNGLDAWGSAKIERLDLKINKYNYETHICRAQKSVAHMEVMGLPIDQEEAQRQGVEWGNIASTWATEAETIYEVKQFVRSRQEEFNIGNPAHVGIALVDYGKLELPRTAGNKAYSTDDQILAPLAANNPLIGATLKYREAIKHKSTYIDPLLRVPMRYPDGNIHPSYTTMKTETLRLSGEDPNAQNWPKRRHRELRRPFCAPPGHLYVACDSGQIQARVFGMASKDGALCQSFIDHVDIHTRWLNRLLDIHPGYIEHLARQTNQSDEAKIRKAGRDSIKSDFVFASFFGASAQSCSDRTGIPLVKTIDLLDEFWGAYPGAKKWLNARRTEYRDTGGIMTLTGRFRYGYMPGNEMIITPIQGGEAEFIIGAQNDLSEMAIESGDMYLHPRINVHDDLTFILPDNDSKLDEYLKIITHEMTRIRFPWQIVPLTVEVKVGYNWCDLEEIMVVEGDYIR